MGPIFGAIWGHLGPFAGSWGQLGACLYMRGFWGSVYFDRAKILPRRILGTRKITA